MKRLKNLSKGRETMINNMRFIRLFIAPKLSFKKTKHQKATLNFSLDLLNVTE